MLVVASLHAQTITVEGYAFAGNNQGYLNEVVVTAYTGATPQGDAISNLEGKFSMELPAGKDYRFVASKGGFKEKEVKGSTKGKAAGDKIYVKIPMERSPGYIFEATLAEGKGGKVVAPSDAVKGATIEIYNNTKKKPELVLRQHKGHNFSHTFEKGNQYIILIRKEGFYTKRIQANVDVNDCILCFEGLSSIQPGVSDNLTAENSAGTLVANIDLRRIVIGEAIEVNNILYEYGKSNITSTAALELDKLAGLLNDNPHITVELGSHTDCRDLQAPNQILSEKRARAAVDYLITKGGIAASRLTYKGYGEMELKLKECDCDKAKPANKKCTEDQHAQNRRTEFKVLQIQKIDEENQGSLASSMMEQSMDEILEEIENSVIQVPEGGFPPQEVAKDVNKAQVKSDTKTNTSEEEWKKIMSGQSEVVQIPADAVPPTGGDKTIQQPTLGKGAAAEANKAMAGKTEAVERVTLPTPRSERVEEVVEEVEEMVEDAIEEVEAPNVSYPNKRSLEVEEMAEEVEEIMEETIETVQEKVTLPTPRNKTTPTVDTPNPPSPITDPMGDADVMPEKMEVDTPEPEKPTLPAIIQPKSNASTPPVKGGIKIPADYTGYKIQLIGAPSPLSTDHEVFKEFAFVTVQETMVGEYLYLIGDFRNGVQADTFMERNILPRFPEAQVVQFEAGKRVKQ